MRQQQQQQLGALCVTPINMMLSLSAEDKLNLVKIQVEMADEYLRTRGYEVVHQHGQRISTNLSLNMPEPDRTQNNEVFVGKIPRDLFENELLPLLESAGHVYKIRYMMEFSGFNRGFAFIKYRTREEALTAVKRLDGAVVRNGTSRIGVKISFDNKCLFFGKLPVETTAKQLIKLLEMADVKGIVAARMSTAKNGQTYRNAHVDFETHDAASKARRLLLPGDVIIFNRKLTLDWAKVDSGKALHKAILDAQIE